MADGGFQPGMSATAKQLLSIRYSDTVSAEGAAQPPTIRWFGKRRTGRRDTRCLCVIIGASRGLGALIAKKTLVLVTPLGDAVVASTRNPSVGFQIFSACSGRIRLDRFKKGLSMKRKAGWLLR
jgi:hypothetical protein